MTINPAQTFSIETKTPLRLKQTVGVDDMRRRSQLGIKAKLFLAFFTLAGLTAVVTVSPTFDWRTSFTPVIR